ncbi:Gfo/Idh/MocA family oxidoreductase [Streptomyces sp. AJS327]|uniref:Gfo/Idh/MocA family protein n=1 Tax=Streptomyces sp. AJS327 TaxID=2545265 RepID=UPI0015DFBF63|nr:Gfo/Idh/MocA family oxidoreductase [Streptomyces sp. AJS327]MBA0052897.1 Gfo/Idh/MocA family oxidoreductase [Streptomyces sp. AJS327]
MTPEQPPAPGRSAPPPAPSRPPSSAGSPAPTRTVRFAGIGCGRVFQRYHLPVAAALPAVQPVGGVDTDPQRAAGALADHPGAWTGTSVKRLLEEARPDLVSVCTPNDAHTEPVLAALDAGVAVLCEKPLADTAGAARRLAEHPAADRLLGVNLPYRFHELLVPLRELTASGAREVTFTFHTAGDRLWRACTPWYGDARRAGGGALLDLGPHALDPLLTLFGEPRLRSCRVDSPEVEERAELELDFDGVPALLRVDRASRRLGMTLTVRTRDGDHTLDFRRGQLHLPDDTVLEATEPHPELAAITHYFGAHTTGQPHAPGPRPDPQAPPGVVPARDALRLQTLVETAYAHAQPFP